MAHQLRTLNALAKNSGSVPNTDISQLITTCNPLPVDLTPTFLQHLHTHDTHTDVQAHAYTHK